ncbi:cytochrome C oxidase subunit II [Tianweitania sediminis]|uniref:Cytochrome C oxidase subunit II n=2 Tax=Tianweitania sediminis TaxID=1502156 RepID=A0A8J7QZL2_9HYPH|nr:cytochrome C oxidase subunit II [Tianweitania sediminis]
MLAGATAIFVLVTVLLALGFRSKEAAGDEKRQERSWIIGLGLLFPSTVLLALLGYGLWVGERLLPRDGPDLVQVQAEGRRWEWIFGYGDLPAVRTLNVLHIPAGRPVDVAITTSDVIHSFWVPRLAGKLDAIPGHVNVLRIEASQPGTYEGRSAEYSGVGYDHHGFTVIAHDAAGWQNFLESGR